MSKEIIMGGEARQALLRGINKVADVVKTSLGPRGRTTVIQNQYGSPIVTKDGVSIAKSISLKDPVENVGASLIIEVASRTVAATGDGTTTATLLAAAILNEGIKLVAAGANPTALQIGINVAVKTVVEELKNISIPVSDNMVAQVGKISSNGDTEIGNLLATAMEKVGNNGIISLDSSNTTENKLEVVEGMQFDRGYISPWFITDTEKREAVTENGDSFVYVLVIDRKMSTISDIKPFFENKEAIQKDTRPFVVIAEDVEGEALAILATNKAKGILNCSAVKGPGYGDRRKQMLDDIATLTGATVLGTEISPSLDKIKLSDLGRAKKVISTKDSTTIIGGMGEPEKIKGRILELEDLITSSNSDFEREKYRERLAKLTGGVAIIRLGAVTDTELKEKKDRAEDALHATRAAVEEGIVPGGGTALLRCIPAVERAAFKLQGDEKIGAQIILKVLEAPLAQIVKNAGGKGDVVVQRVIDGTGNFGYNAALGYYDDLVETGIIDPVKTVRVALQNAASIASLLLVTDALLVEMPDPMPTIHMPQQ